MENYPLNEFEESGMNKPGYCYLQIGSPGPKLLEKVSEMMKIGLMKTQERSRHEEILQYGCLKGWGFLRKELAEFLSRQYGQHVNSDDLFVTSGATGGLDFLMKHFFTNDQVIFVENPTYQTFARHVTYDDAMKVVPIEMQCDGIDIKMLEEKCELLPPFAVTQRRPFRAAMYVIATHHNPTGCCYSPGKCRKLVELARKYDILIVCDDVYNFLNYSTDPIDSGKFAFAPQRLFLYDEKTDTDYKGNVVSNGSFSKFAAPGLRLGWFELPKRICEAIENTYVIESGSGLGSFSSFIMADLLGSELMDKHVQHVRQLYKIRMEKSISIIEDHVGKYGVKCSRPTGGCFLWLTLPQNVSLSDLKHVCDIEGNVAFIQGNACSVNDSFKNCIRLSIAFYEETQLIRGIESLCKSIAKCINKN